MIKRYLITGGCGFLGTNLADEVLAGKSELCIFDNLSRAGSQDNLSWLLQRGKFEYLRNDIRDLNAIESAISKFRPDVIFHLAGQVTMTKSVEDPKTDFEVNALGTVNLLEAIRKLAPETTVIYSSTNKVYGGLEQIRYSETETRYLAPDYPDGFDEKISLDFRSPYGCSKGAADQYMLDYARMFGLKTIVFRHSSIYGDRQFATYDQGWIGWFCEQALNIQQGKNKDLFTISGNGKQVRDVLHEEDLRRLYFLAEERIDQVAGEVFNIGGGPQNSISLLELFSELEALLDIHMNHRQLPSRASDQKVFIANISKAMRLLQWAPQVNVCDGVKRMVNWLCHRNMST